MTTCPSGVLLGKVGQVNGRFSHPYDPLVVLIGQDHTTVTPRQLFVPSLSHERTVSLFVRVSTT